MSFIEVVGVVGQRYLEILAPLDFVTELLQPLHCDQSSLLMLALAVGIAQYTFERLRAHMMERILLSWCIGAVAQWCVWRVQYQLQMANQAREVRAPMEGVVLDLARAAVCLGNLRCLLLLIG